jgi:tRNA pseudouridine38-40 synthase
VTRFALTVEYDGRPFMGWQRQDHGPSVQAAIERAANEVTGEAGTLTSGGRSRRSG